MGASLTYWLESSGIDFRSCFTLEYCLEHKDCCMSQCESIAFMCPLPSLSGWVACWRVREQQINILVRLFWHHVLRCCEPGKATQSTENIWKVGQPERSWKSKHEIHCKIVKSFQVRSLQAFVLVPALIWVFIKGLDNRLESIHTKWICRWHRQAGAPGTLEDGFRNQMGRVEGWCEAHRMKISKRECRELQFRRKNQTHK